MKANNWREKDPRPCSLRSLGVASQPDWRYLDAASVEEFIVGLQQLFEVIRKRASGQLNDAEGVA